MDNKDVLLKVFTGREIQGIILKGELEAIGIATVIKNDYEAGLSAGFVSGTPPDIELYINENDLKAAEPIINDFIKSNG